MINLKIIKKESLDFNTNLLKPKNNLFPEFWSNNQLSSRISSRLLKIAEDIVTFMDIKIDIKDLIITGSIASYNWHEGSDIDLHILLDFKKIEL